MPLTLPEFDFRLMLPEIFLFLWALVVITTDILTRRKSATLISYMALAGVLATLGILGVTGSGSGFGVMFFNDPIAIFFKVIFLGAALLAILSSFNIIENRIKNHRGEFYGLFLFSTVGMMFLASSNETLSLYIGLELTTLPLMVLAAFYKDDRLSVEAGIKYFVVGAFSSALLVFGLSYLYGMSGTTDLVQMKINLSILFLTHGEIGLVLILAMVLILAGIGCKLAFPPFHQWAPDVYQGAPTPIAAFLSVGSKAAGVVAFAKIFVNGLYGFHGPEMSPNDWGQMVAVIAILAMITGNVLAFRQKNIKRMLAYSSIAQAGYIMIGMVTMNELGLASVAFYTFVYLFANLGVFAIVTMVEDRTGSSQIESYTGLSQKSPFLSASMGVFLLSLAGIPPLAGFFAKYYVFAAAIEMAQASPINSWLYWLVGVGLLTAVFSLYYYASIIKKMYFSTESSSFKLELTAPTASVIIIALLGVSLFGLFPEPLLQMAREISLSYGFMAN